MTGSTKAHIETKTKTVPSNMIKKSDATSFDGVTSSFHHLKRPTVTEIVSVVTICRPALMFGRLAEHMRRPGSGPGRLRPKHGCAQCFLRTVRPEL